MKDYQSTHRKSTNKNDAFNIFIRQIGESYYQAILTCEVPRLFHPDTPVTQNKIDIAAAGQPAGCPRVGLALLSLLSVTREAVAKHLKRANEGTGAILDGDAAGEYLNLDVYKVK